MGDFETRAGFLRLMVGEPLRWIKQNSRSSCSPSTRPMRECRLVSKTRTKSMPVDHRCRESSEIGGARIWCEDSGQQNTPALLCLSGGLSGLEEFSLVLSDPENELRTVGVCNRGESKSTPAVGRGVCGEGAGRLISLNQCALPSCPALDRRLGHHVDWLPRLAPDITGPKRGLMALKFQRRCKSFQNLCECGCLCSLSDTKGKLREVPSLGWQRRMFAPATVVKHSAIRGLVRLGAFTDSRRTRRALL
jgi:hypothetical protein